MPESQLIRLYRKMKHIHEASMAGFKEVDAQIDSLINRVRYSVLKAGCSRLNHRIQTDRLEHSGMYTEVNQLIDVLNSGKELSASQVRLITKRTAKLDLAVGGSSKTRPRFESEVHRVRRSIHSP